MPAADLEEVPPLPDIDDVAPVSEADEACLREVREVLERHGALSRFGVWLLHEHFALAPDEVMVETIDAQNRTLTLRPRPVGEAQDAVETSWRLDTPSGQRRCETQCVRPSGSRGAHVRQHFAL